ncbi:hypothetical protein LEP1GSC170_1850 [Leptospira interrogans serovar Bataviae str. HAI135]|nr:hypothetical protein LEP1GSC170_1850 [Leptospira interrogans serovar Bataviae str. HAI135]
MFLKTKKLEDNVFNINFFIRLLICGPYSIVFLNSFIFLLILKW